MVDKKKGDVFDKLRTVLVGGWMLVCWDIINSLVKGRQIVAINISVGRWGR